MTWSKWTGVQRPTLDEELRLLTAERSAEVERWDERGVCHGCGHWRTEHCNADGFAYCDEHYPEGLR